MRLEEGMAYLTADEMAIVDRDAADKFGISVESMMEKAGLAAAKLANRLLAEATGPRAVTVLVGKGNNGGDGLVAARLLSDWGIEVKVVLGAGRTELRDLPALGLRAAEEKGLKVVGVDEALARAGLVVDALLGYGSSGNPREPVSGLIRRTNESRIPVMAVDLPSGLDASGGEPGDPCIKAKSTVTFGFPKSGFLNPRAVPHLGRLFLADIGFDQIIYRRFGMDGRPFIPGDSLLEVNVPKPSQGF